MSVACVMHGMRGKPAHPPCLHCQVATLVDALRFVRQTVHQAHHDGPIEACTKNTCDAATKALAAVERQ